MHIHVIVAEIFCEMVVQEIAVHVLMGYSFSLCRLVRDILEEGFADTNDSLGALYEATDVYMITVLQD